MKLREKKLKLMWHKVHVTLKNIRRTVDFNSEEEFELIIYTDQKYSQYYQVSNEIDFIESASWFSTQYVQC